MNVISSKQSQIPPVLPMLETFLELCVVCVCSRAFKDQPSFILFKSLALVIGSPLQLHLLLVSTPCPQCSRHTCLLLVSAAHETYSCLGPFQQLFPLYEFLILLIFLCRALPLISQIFLKYHILREVLSGHSVKSHLIMCYAITLLSFHSPNLNKFAYLPYLERCLPHSRYSTDVC